MTRRFPWLSEAFAHELVFQSREIESTSRCFAVVAFQDATKFAVATNDTFRLRDEVFVQYRVVPTHATMWPMLVIMSEPRFKNSVELWPAEAEKIVQTFALRTRDKALGECIRLGRLHGNTDTSDIRIPKLIEFVGKLSVSVPNQKPWRYALVGHPHRRISSLLHNPLGIRMIGAWTTKNFSAPQMDEDENIALSDTQRHTDINTHKRETHTNVRDTHT